MFIRTARTQQPISLILIPLLGIILWLPGFLNPSPPTIQALMPFYAPVDAFCRLHPFFSVFMGFVFSLGTAFVLNFIIHQHQILTKKSWLPALLFLVLSSSTKGFLWLNPELIAGIFILLSLHFLLETYRMDNAIIFIFNAGFFIGLATLFYFPSIVFVLFSIISIILLRPFTFREWMIMLLGSTIVPIYVCVYYFWHNQLYIKWQELVVIPILNRAFFINIPQEFYCIVAAMAFLFLVSALKFLTGADSSALKTKTGISVMIWFLVFAILGLLVAQNLSVAGTILAFFPISIFCGNYFLQARRAWLSEFIFLTLLLSIGCTYAIHLKWIVF